VSTIIGEQDQPEGMRMVDKSFLINKIAAYAVGAGQSNLWTHPSRIDRGPTRTVGKATRCKKKRRKAQRIARRLNR